MADFSDVTAALQAAIVRLAYPNGPGMPSAIGVEVQVAEGWPLPAALDAICGKPGIIPPSSVSLVTIYPVPGTTSDASTSLDTNGVVKSRTVAGLAFTIEDATLTLSGVAAGVENVVVLANKRSSYSVQAKAGDTAPDVAAALFAQIEPVFPGSALDLSAPAGPTIDFVGIHDVVARIGTTGILQRTTHRERQQVRITIWSSNQADRNVVAKPIDRMIKAQVRFDLPDGTDSIVTYVGSNPSDDPQRLGLYRRDLIYAATCDTVEELEAVEITAFGFQSALPSGSTINTFA